MMTRRPVKSTDPRKPQIMTALKYRASAGRVTQVKEITTPAAHYFEGHCYRYVPGDFGGRGGYQSLGVFQVMVGPFPSEE